MSPEKALRAKDWAFFAFSGVDIEIKIDATSKK
jgi:hypothetical protein